MKKASIAISIFACVITCSIFVFTYINKQNHEDVILSLGTYSYDIENSGMPPPSISLKENSEFTFWLHSLSSYIGHGSYSIEGSELTLLTDDKIIAITISSIYENSTFALSV